MQKAKINHLIIKNIGFLNYDKNFRSKVEKDSCFLNKNFNDETYDFLNNSYHTEYTNIMFPAFDNQGINRFVKELNFEIEICNIQTSVLLTNVELFIFNDSYRSEQTALFSLDYLKDNCSLEDVSNISFH